VRNATAHPVIDHLTALHADSNYPRAVAVVQTFIAKLDRIPDAENVPLEQLVTPAALDTWRATFRNPEQREHLALALRFHGVSTTGRPRPDGSIMIPLIEMHPDQDEPLVINEPRLVWGYRVCLELVAEPADWRIRRIE
jgi:hypothetical protein